MPYSSPPRRKVRTRRGVVTRVELRVCATVELFAAEIRQGLPRSVTTIARESRLRVRLDDRGLAFGSRTGQCPGDSKKRSDGNRPDYRSLGHEAIGQFTAGWKERLVSDGPCLGFVMPARWQPASDLDDRTALRNVDLGRDELDDRTDGTAVGHALGCVIPN